MFPFNFYLTKLIPNGINKVMQPEARLQKKIVDFLNSLPKTKAEKNHGSAYGKPKLDISGACFGRMFQMEVKTSTGKPTKRQLQLIQDWLAVDVVAGIVRSKDDAYKLIRPLFGGIDEILSDSDRNNNEP